MEQTSIQIIKALRRNGYEAYWAGGCVRDLIMENKIKDYDIVTSAKPEEIENLLEKTIPVGKQFGVILALLNNHRFEIATFRSDSGYSDGRRPDAIYYTSAKQDALRRDFTVNGIFYDPISKKIIDYVGGQKDIKAKLIRFIGNPEVRIKEDHLRILRAIRFRNALSFQYHPDTYNALHKYKHLISKVSAERIQEELTKILLDKNRAQAFEDMFDIDVLSVILPEIYKMRGVAQPYQYHQEGDVFIHTMHALKALGKRTKTEVAWATLLHDVGKPDTFNVAEERIRFDGHVSLSREIAKKILKRLKFPSRRIEKITWLIEHHMLLGQIPDMPLGRQRHWLLHPWFADLLRVHRADDQGSIPSDPALYHKCRALMQEVKKKLPKKLPKLISGHDLFKYFKIKPGPEIGRLLELVYYAQLAEEIKTKKQALEFVKNHLRPEILGK